MTKSAFGIDHVSKAFAGAPTTPSAPKLKPVKPVIGAKVANAVLKPKPALNQLSPTSAGPKKPMKPAGPAMGSGGGSKVGSGMYPVQPPRRQF